MGTWRVFGAVLLMLIPAVGLLIAAIWALGGCRNENKKRLARAFLLLVALSVVLLALAVLVFRIAVDDSGRIFDTLCKNGLYRVKIVINDIAILFS